MPGGGPTPLAGVIRRSLEIAGMVQAARSVRPLIVLPDRWQPATSRLMENCGSRLGRGEDEKNAGRQGAALGYRSDPDRHSRRTRRRDDARNWPAPCRRAILPAAIVSASAVTPIRSAELQKGPSQGDRQMKTVRHLSDARWERPGTAAPGNEPNGAGGHLEWQRPRKWAIGCPGARSWSTGRGPQPIRSAA